MIEQQRAEAQEQELNMTVAQAITRYKTKAAYPTRSLRDVIGAVIEKGESLTLENDSYADALEYTEAMLAHTHSSLEVVTGCNCGSFYATLLMQLRGALRRVQETNGSARIIVAGGAYPEWLTALAYEFSDTLKLARAQTGKVLQHFIVCDHTTVRLEEPHDEIGQESPANAIKAKVIFNESGIGGELRDRFADIWRCSEVSDLDPTQKPTAPSWIIQRMDALRHLPWPTSEKVASQMSASIATRKRLTDKATA